MKRLGLRVITGDVSNVTSFPFLAQLFQRCLMKVLHIDLWKCYLSYVRETKGKLPSYKYVIPFFKNIKVTHCLIYGTWNR